MRQLESLGRWFKRRFGSCPFRKRYDVVNYFASEWGLEEYLEIGMARGRCLERVRCARKTGVDPNPRFERPEWNLQKMTSDAFFAASEKTFDLILIDGLHLAEQVLRDIFNSLRALSPGGAIVLHDCSPRTEAAQGRDPEQVKGEPWNGDVWKAIAFVRETVPGLFCRVLDFDHGIGVILPEGEREPAPLTAEMEKRAEEFFARLSWADLEARRAELLGLLHTREELESEMRRAGVPRASSRQPSP